MEEFNFNLDQKVTTWYRTNFEVEAESLEEAQKKAIQLYESGKLDNISWEQIDGTIELMSVDENGGFTTAEIYTDNGTMIFENTKEN
jgi:nicotinate-nucleotide pyrophosphorylase